MNALLMVLSRLGRLQGEAVDRMALHEAAEAAMAQTDTNKQLQVVVRNLQLKPVRWLGAPDAAQVPALIHDDERGWGILRGLNGQGSWVCEHPNLETQEWVETKTSELRNVKIVRMRLSKPFDASKSPVFSLIKTELAAQKKIMLDAAIGGVVVNLLVLASSFYSMHVYDRVVPTGAMATLLVLTLGVILAALFEFVVKHLRSGLYERLVEQVDKRLSRVIYTRFLAIRLDQLPSSVGGLASQLRGYESVRGFLTSLTSSLIVDAPFAIAFLILIALISGWLALIPVAFFVLSVSLGLYYKNQVNVLAEKATAAGNQKTGLLVEAIEGAETIKSGQGGWRMLSRWLQTTDEARDYENQTRHIQERSQHLMAACQQISYVLLIASGALLISKGEMTVGGLIACSILSGRVLSPAGMIPNQLVQWAHAKAALAGLDRLWALESDHHDCEHPLVPAVISGDYKFENVGASYGGNKALAIGSLIIRAGEKIGVLGPIGGGKTTFLRLLSGMYKPQEGRVLLDGMELSHVFKPALAESIGYLQQDGRLFSGTLRDNLVLGMIDPGDDAIHAAAKVTGLMAAVIAPHPKGLQQIISEGGTGLSGGQRQLVNLTRVFLRKPAVWLLDEPTASVDRNLEMQIIAAMRQTLRPEDTLVVVTHKKELLDVVDRLIVIANHQVVMDGPKELVLEQLQGGAAKHSLPRRAISETATVVET